MLVHVYTRRSFHQLSGCSDLGVVVVYRLPSGAVNDYLYFYIVNATNYPNFAMDNATGDLSWVDPSTGACIVGA